MVIRDGYINPKMSDLHDLGILEFIYIIYGNGNFVYMNKTSFQQLFWKRMMMLAEDDDACRG